MTDAQFVEQVASRPASKDAADVELDKLLLRLFERPALLQYLQGVGQSGRSYELDFIQLPPPAVEEVCKIIGPIDITVLQYEKDGRPHVGFRFDLHPLLSTNP